VSGIQQKVPSLPPLYTVLLLQLLTARVHNRICTLANRYTTTKEKGDCHHQTPGEPNILFGVVTPDNCWRFFSCKLGWYITTGGGSINNVYFKANGDQTPKVSTTKLERYKLACINREKG